MAKTSQENDRYSIIRNFFFCDPCPNAVSCVLIQAREKSAGGENIAEMSLVDYGSSDDEAPLHEKEHEEEKEVANENEQSQVPSSVNSCNRNSVSPSHEQLAGVSSLSTGLLEKLPDAASLLDSPAFPMHHINVGDHASRVAAALAESASRKRESNGSAFPHPVTKLPRGNLRSSRNVPDTLGGMLVPPQLSGRSNVVTEDIVKLFVNRRPDLPH